MSDTRADTTSMGLLGISFILLVFGLIGILGYSDTPGAEWFGLVNASMPMMAGAAILFLFIGYTNWKSGNKFLMYIFAFLGLFSAGYAICTAEVLTGVNVYLFFVVVAIFLFIFAFVTLLSKAGLMLTLLLVAAALVFLFYSLFVNAFTTGEDWHTFMLMVGVFAILGFLISLYMALADITDLNLPVV